MAKGAIKEKSILDWAMAWLEERLPEEWNLTAQESEAGPTEAILRLDARHVFADVVVEVRDSLSPRQAEQMLWGFGRALRSVNPGTALLVLAPWLSERTREILAAERINYLDRTGNSLIRLANPALFIATQGAAKNPEPRKRGRAQVRGPKAARLIRLLTDVRPPYGVSDLAASAGLAPGYVSRMLDTLYDEALIERAPRGPVESVDVPGLIRRWATSYDLLETNRATSYIARTGLDPTLDELSNRPSEAPRFAVTGSVAAIRLAPVTGPALLVAYCDRPAELARDLGLLPSSEGANVVLLEPFDEVVWLRNESDAGLRFAAPAQVAVDCLTGTGRMPAEGESVLDWMTTNEERWRLATLPDPEAE